MSLTLDAHYIPGADFASTRLDLALTNAGPDPLSGFTLVYTALCRAARDGRMENAELLRRIANFHEILPPAGFVLKPGATWRFSIIGVASPARHRLDGPKTAYLDFNGTIEPVACTDLVGPADKDTGELRSIPRGAVKIPMLALPFPQQVGLSELRPGPVTYHLGEDGSIEEKTALAKIDALSNRLHPKAPRPFRMTPARGSLEVAFQDDPTAASEAYRMSFDEGRVNISHNGSIGRDRALTTLAQIALGANTDPQTYHVPMRGTLADSPRFAYRGAHLDVSRHFWPKDDILRFLDILAWAKINVFQWHLTDDEGWRLAIDAFPELTSTGALRGPGCAQVAQLGFAGEVYGGHYTKADIREVIARADSLNITVIPEIDIPGHCTAVLKTYPHLIDPNEPENSYFSIQGYPNNALNPAMPETYEFLEKVFEEVAQLFPGEFVHIGGDEVDAKSWMTSPLVKDLMQKEGLADTHEVQAHFLRKVQAMLRGLGKKLAGWDEVSHGGGVDPDGVLLVAWQRPEVTRELIEQGYEVVCSPGQAYYMDMAQASGWNEPGAGWAGFATPEHTYTFEPDAGLAVGKAAALKGVQACIWCEHLTSKDLFNHMVFPRLYAVAEAGWTDPQSKDWMRFAANSHHFPQL